MPQYVMLVNWTDQGVRNAKDTVQRTNNVTQRAQQMGCRLEPVLWTQGRYDLVAILEAPDDETASAFSLAASTQGSVRTETLRAFTEQEMQTILGKLP